MTKHLCFFTKKLLLSSQKSRLRIRDPEKKLVPDPDQGAKEAPDPGFATLQPTFCTASFSKPSHIQEFELIDRKELAPLQELIDRLTNGKA